MVDINFEVTYHSVRIYNPKSKQKIQQNEDNPNSTIKNFLRI